MTRAVRTPPSRHDFTDCIAECEECHRVCLSAIDHCLMEGGDHATADHIRLLQDCAQICATSADFMIRSSPLHVHTCLACAEVCERCAEECERRGNDEAMQRCAEACRACAESCRKMSEMPIA
ncbi:MAG TPA: four-helix bundle copper-binding protein [Candidatus Polarisedimenticolaceae bacterium]|nr:four-helix bundle copper-binding protein [Candidatus Polarisedimenticolaceae bacterium]